MDSHSWPATLAVGLVAALIGGWPIYKEAMENTVERRITMELSMTLALVAALAIGQFLTALVIIFFVLIAEVLEGGIASRGSLWFDGGAVFLARSLIKSDIHVEELKRWNAD